MRIFILIILLLTSLITYTYSGDLDDFEKGITDEDEEDNYDDSDSDSDGECIGEGCGVCLEILADETFHIVTQLIVDAAVKTGVVSHNIATGKNGEIKRKKGSILLPIIRLDSSYSYIKKDLYSINNRIELGFGAISLVTDVNIYNESNPDDKLYQIDGLVLYRMSFSRNFEVDISLGVNNILGDSSTFGVKSGLPIRIKANDYLGIEVRPALIYLENNVLYDLDSSLFIGRRFIGLTAGYKLFGDNNNILHGPYIGVRTML